MSTPLKGGDNLRENTKQLTLRIPRTLHAELLEEAEREGTSLNQLCLTKLARPLDWYRQMVVEHLEKEE
jgi:predicted HicB family RNase H-like nuclease